MSKTLTEQWREGTLENGFYYVMSGWSTSIEIRYLGEGFFEGNIEVLAPVPTYDEYRELLDLNVYEKDRKKVMRLEDKVKRLQKQLCIATKALKEYADITNWDDGVFMCVYDGTSFADEESAEEALKEIEGVK